MIDWDDLKIFLALERGGSARAAAHTLCKSHSTVLRRLNELERRLGVKVFDRTPEGLVLSAPGSLLLSKVEKIEAHVLEAQREVGGADSQLKGTIRLTAPPAVLKYVMMPYLAEFQNSYPDIEIEIVPTNNFADLDRRHADVAIRFSEDPGDHLVGRRLPEFRDAIFATPDYVYKHFFQGSSVTAKWIGWTDKSRFARRISPFELRNRPIAWSLPTMTLQAEAARQGYGMALLPCVLGDNDTYLTRVPRTPTIPNLPAWLLTHPGLRRIERVSVFSRIIIARLENDRDKLSGEVTKSAS